MNFGIRLMSVAAICLMTAVLQGQSSQTLSKPDLVAALQHGGFVILMRHASSPLKTPDKASANADNVKLERQLDATGRATAAAMGAAIRNLKIPIGDVLTSPTYRANETARLAQFPHPMAAAELGDNGQSMQAIADSQAQWLRKKVTEAPGAGNTILVTHMPNIARAFPDATGLTDGEALIFHPDGKGAAPLVGRIKIDEWPKLPR